MKSAKISAGLLSLLLLAPTPSCSSDPERTAALAVLADRCLVNSDCTSPLVCAFQRCHVECVTTRDCDDELRCVGAHEPERVCQLELEATCRSSTDCVPGFVCGQDGACRDTCERDQHCIDQQLCVNGTCAEPSELDDQGNLPQVCRLASDCAEGSICLVGICRSQCRSDRDCSAAEVCEGGACRLVETEPACSCQQDVDCPMGETCDGCACQAGPAPECTTAADCAPLQCVDGECLCNCVDDRDCPPATECDDCACIPLVPKAVVHDAVIESVLDIELMRGITEVQETLRITGLVTSTAGLEALHTVGQLEIVDISAPEGATASVLAGLSGLRLIRRSLLIQNGNLTALPFHPDLRIDGGVDVDGSGLTCPVLNEFEQQLHSNYGEEETKPLVDWRNTSDCSEPFCLSGTCLMPP